MLVDLRRRTSRPRRGRSTPTGAARRGRTRCSRTTPSSGWGCGSPPTATPSSPAAGLPSCATPWALSSSTRSCLRRSCASPSCASSASGSPSSSVGSRPGRSGRPPGGGPAQRARPPDPAQRLDRRRRRLGLRHRLGRARSRAGQRQERQRAGDGHRGVLQHRRADVEGDAARRGGQVRRRRQDRPDQGPRPPGDRATPTCTWRGWRWAPIHSRR